MARMLSGDTNQIKVAEALLFVWARVEEAELRRLAPGCTLSGMLCGSGGGEMPNGVTVEDIEMVGVMMQDLAVVFPSQYRVLYLYYKKRMKIDDVRKAMDDISRSSVKKLRVSGLVYAVAWMRRHEKKC